MTTKQRAYLKSLAMTMDPIFQIGKSSMTPSLTQAISEALDARELIKISVLQNCADDPRALAEMVAERTRSQVVQVIGKKIVLYKEGKDDKKSRTKLCALYSFIPIIYIFSNSICSCVIYSSCTRVSCVSITKNSIIWRPMAYPFSSQYFSILFKCSCALSRAP